MLASSPRGNSSHSSTLPRATCTVPATIPAPAPIAPARRAAPAGPVVDPGCASPCVSLSIGAQDATGVPPRPVPAYRQRRDGPPGPAGALPFSEEREAMEGRRDATVDAATRAHFTDRAA